jgi:N-methylhydantoinase B
LAREPERVLTDVREGFVTPEVAERDYGVVVKREGATFALDQAATQARRAKVTM